MLQEQALARTQEDLAKVAIQVLLSDFPRLDAGPAPAMLAPTPIRLPVMPRWPHVPTPAIPGLATGNQGMVGGGPQRRPRRAVVFPLPPPPCNNEDDDDDLYVRELSPMGRQPPRAREPTEERLVAILTPEEIARLVGAGITAARTQEQPQNEA